MIDITEAIGKVVARMRPINDAKYGPGMMDYITSLNTRAENYPLMPFYMYGSRLEIAGELLAMENDKIRKYQKYPLIALRLPAKAEQHGGMVHWTLNLAILAFTDQNYTTEQRMENVFKPVLFPLYNEFIKNLRKVSLFTFVGSEPNHFPIVRPYWGTEYSEGNKAHLFNDPLDAIELINFQIATVKSKCAPLALQS